MSVKFLRDFVEEEVRQILREKGLRESAEKEERERAIVEFMEDYANPIRLKREYEERHNITAEEGEFREALSQHSCLEFRLGVLLQNHGQTVLLGEHRRTYCLGQANSCRHRRGGEFPICNSNGKGEYRASAISEEFLDRFDGAFIKAIKEHKWFASRNANGDVGHKFAVSDFAARYAGKFCRVYASELAASLGEKFTGARLSVNLRARIHVYDSGKDVMLEDYTVLHEFNGHNNKI